MTELEELEARQLARHREQTASLFRRIAERLDDETLGELRTSVWCLGQNVRNGSHELVLDECVRILHVLREAERERGLP